MELIRSAGITVLSNSGIQSHQLLSPENSSSSRVTITGVVVAPGAVNPRHRHETSEQIWVAVPGAGTLLLADERSLPFEEGDIAGYADGEVHGLENTGPVAFAYMAVTSPPIGLRAAYARAWSGPA